MGGKNESILVRIPSKSMMNEKQQQAPSVKMQEDPANLNYSADYQVAQMIVNSLKSNELSSGREYSAQDLESLIRQRFQGVNDNIVKLAIDMIMNDVEDMNSR